jgi:hypothetical protein
VVELGLGSFGVPECKKKIIDVRSHYRHLFLSKDFRNIPSFLQNKSVTKAIFSL